MAKVYVSQLKSGAILQNDVLTLRGNLLFNKGSKVEQREIDILQAFQIESVSIKPLESPEVIENDQEPMQKRDAKFHENYHVMLALLKQTFRNLSTVNDIPVMDIRNTLEILVNSLQHYNVLTFQPISWKIEDQLYHKSIKVGLTAYTLAQWLGMKTKDLIPVAMGGLLHDIGNMRIDRAILEKPAPLSKEELAIMQQHTVEGYNILKDIPGLNEGVKLSALQHHEREDGSGYPLGIKGDQIHKYAKIIAVADIYHAMTSQRYHKDPISPYLVLEQLYKESFGKLDPKLVQTFINRATRFSKGTVVKLNDGSVGEIIFTEVNDPTRPWVKVDDTIINLTIQRHLFIEKVIKGH